MTPATANPIAPPHYRRRAPSTPPSPARRTPSRSTRRRSARPRSCASPTRSSAAAIARAELMIGDLSSASRTRPPVDRARPEGALGGSAHRPHAYNVEDPDAVAAARHRGGRQDHLTHSHTMFYGRRGQAGGPCSAEHQQILAGRHRGRLGGRRCRRAWRGVGSRRRAAPDLLASAAPPPAGAGAPQAHRTHRFMERGHGGPRRLRLVRQIGVAPHVTQASPASWISARATTPRHPGFGPDTSLPRRPSA